MLDSALYQSAYFSIGDFRQNPFSYLSVESLASSMEADRIDCTLLCVSKRQCYSFNMAAFPDSKGLYLCELLANDKHRSKTKLHANATFHHYSPQGKARRTCFFLFFLFFFLLIFFFGGRGGGGGGTKVRIGVSGL